MSRERPTINSAAGDELWLLKSCQCWSTSHGSATTRIRAPFLQLLARNSDPSRLN